MTAVTSEPTLTLKTLAGTIDSGPITAAESDAIDRLRRNVKAINEVFLSVGEDIDLLKRQGWSYLRIAESVEEGKSTIENYHKCWMAFPKVEALTVGEKVATYAQALTAHQVAQRLKRTGENVPPKAILKEIVSKNLSARKARAKFERRILDNKLNKMRAATLATVKAAGGAMVNRCHERSCVDVLADLSNGSVHLAWVDGPYFDYHDSKGDGLRQDSYSGLCLTGAANRTKADILPILLNLFAGLRDKLAHDGAVVYWANGLAMDNWQVGRAIEEAGMYCAASGIWAKGMQIGDAATPFTQGGERYLVLARQGVTLRNFDYNLSRNNIITDIPSVPQTRSAGEVYHQMQKPVALADRFMRKLCAPRSLVFDAFGCSGSACVAAHRLGHDWVYCEVEKTNYAFGTANISEALKEVKTA